MLIRKKCYIYSILASVLVIAGKVYAGHGAMQQHQPLEITPLLKKNKKSKAPEVSLLVQADIDAGWNVHIQTKHFTFAPQNAGSENRLGEGHAHLYVDDYKLARVYGEWFHIPNLRPGKHMIKVSLNANDHSPLMLDGVLIESSVEVMQEEKTDK